MSTYRHVVCGIDRRKFVLGAGALASAGLVQLGQADSAAAARRPRKETGAARS